ncbi:MAG: Do family serine endopeptidase [Parvibaculales bacterium]
MTQQAHYKKHPIYFGCFYAFFGLVIAFFVPPALAQDVAVPQNRKQIQMSFAPVVEKAAPAVVNVYAKRRVSSQRRSLFDDPFFNDFFDRQFRSRPRVQNSLGSGVIVRSDGIVVTNNHVIEGSDELTIVLPDQREFGAELLLADARTDLAVMKLKTDGETVFPVLDYQSEDAVAIGDLVLAIGNPFGVGQTVTSGIVSALARTQVGVSDFQSFIQTDAPINPGNSGGALVTMQGRLLGVNTAIYSRTGGSVGIGFAIPSSMVRRVVEGALGDGQVRRPWLGMRLQPVSQDLVQTLGLARPMGALVLEMHPNSPFAAAGLKSGDVIVKVAGVSVDRPEELRYRLAIRDIGEKIIVAYMRGGKALAADVTLVLAPETPARNRQSVQVENLFYGVELSNINPAVIEEVGLRFDAQGVMVSAVAGRNRLGLRVGDILEKINGQKVETVTQAMDVIGGNMRGWSLEIRRGNRLIRSTVR